MRVAIVWSTAMLAAAPYQALAGEASHREVDAIFAPWDRPGTPGCAVGIARDGVVNYTRGYGMANLEHGIPITPRTVFHTASISKQFTAFAIGLLAQEGKLRLDDDIRRYLPQWPADLPPITIAQMGPLQAWRSATGACAASWPCGWRRYRELELSSHHFPRGPCPCLQRRH